jgi:hypothetical protein
LRIYGFEAGCAALSDSGICYLTLPSEARRVRIFADTKALRQNLAAADAPRGLARRRTNGRRVARQNVGEDANEVFLRGLRTAQ